MGKTYRKQRNEKENMGGFNESLARERRPSRVADMRVNMSYGYLDSLGGDDAVLDVPFMCEATQDDQAPVTLASDEGLSYSLAEG